MLFAFLFYPISPLRSCRWIGEDSEAESRMPEHIQVVHVAQRILHFFKIPAPRFMQAGEEVFNGVSKTLDSDAQVVERDVSAIAQCPTMQRMSFVPTF